MAESYLISFYSRSKMSPKNSIIMFPTNATSLILGRKLISEEHDLYLYCPLDVHKRQAQTTPQDLKIAALGLNTCVTVLDSLEKMEMMNYIYFPTLDVLPDNKRTDFGKTCKELFQ